MVKRLEYLGIPTFPEEPAIDVGREKYSFQLKCHAYRCPIWLTYQAQLNHVCARIMALAVCDAESCQSGGVDRSGWLSTCISKM